MSKKYEITWVGIFSQWLITRPNKNQVKYNYDNQTQMLILTL